MGGWCSRCEKLKALIALNANIWNSLHLSLSKEDGIRKYPEDTLQDRYENQIQSSDLRMLKKLGQEPAS